jgi:hypothetical protein
LYVPSNHLGVAVGLLADRSEIVIDLVPKLGAVVLVVLNEDVALEEGGISTCNR